MDRTLSTLQDTRYQSLKKVVRDGIGTWLEVGNALLEISVNKLYKDEYPTFEEFAQKEFNLTKRYAYKMIEAANVVKELPSALKGTPIAQALALKKVPKKKRAEVLEKAGTVKEIEDAAKPVIELDQLGKPIPDTIVDEWLRADETGKRLMSEASGLKCELDKALKDGDAVFAEITNSTVADLKNTYNAVSNIRPFTICTSCQGRQPKKCRLCRGRGFLSDFLYHHAVPESTRKIWEKK